MLIKLPKIVIGNLEYQMGKSLDLEILNYNQIYAENRITRLGHHLDYINTLHGAALMTHPKPLCSQYFQLSLHYYIANLESWGECNYLFSLPNLSSKFKTY